MSLGWCDGRRLLTRNRSVLPPKRDVWERSASSATICHALRFERPEEGAEEGEAEIDAEEIPMTGVLKALLALVVLGLMLAAIWLVLGLPVPTRIVIGWGS